MQTTARFLNIIAQTIESGCVVSIHSHSNKGYIMKVMQLIEELAILDPEQLVYVGFRNEKGHPQAQLSIGTTTTEVPTPSGGKMEIAIVMAIPNLATPK